MAGMCRENGGRRTRHPPSLSRELRHEEASHAATASSEIDETVEVCQYSSASKKKSSSVLG